jgi:hypothetical protein
MEKDMYAGMQTFHRKFAQIMTHLDKAQTKNMEFVAIRAGLNEMKRWIKENQMPHKTYVTIEWENDLNYTTLDNCQ